MMKLRVYFHGSKEGSCFLHRNCKRTPEELKKNTRREKLDYLSIPQPSTATSPWPLPPGRAYKGKKLTSAFYSWVALKLGKNFQVPFVAFHQSKGRIHKTRNLFSWQKVCLWLAGCHNINYSHFHILKVPYLYIDT